ncbi:E3 ubiquitin-protein ligase makorin [Iris pallida]|uniref:E3 ubiquitin-protein ligase makorin n=1 Tax=Iris pallida TaxID=29817 RepID=A0AAX6DP29_IRIPA|nr:E3 ubiquitin-protein ligase makorin [Iris pallida]
MAKIPLLLFVFFFLTPIQAMGSSSYSGFTYDATHKIAADSTEEVSKPLSSAAVVEPEKKKQPEQTLVFHELFSFADRFDWLLSPQNLIFLFRLRRNLGFDLPFKNLY